ncbi:MAG: response regulator, partial [Planctomycetota bacterium]
MPHHALIVDDEPSICWALKRALEGESFKTAVASTAEEGLELAKQTSFAIVLLDVRLPGIDGLSALPQFQATTNNAPIIVMTAFGDLDTAVSAVRLGASDYLTKPFKLEDILQTCHRAVKSASKSMPKRDSTTDAEDFIVGKSAAMQQVFKQIAVVADSDLPVLITGETGTGKELVAQAIARHSS